MINQLTPSEIGQLVTQAINEASVKRQIDKIEALKVFWQAYEEHKQRYGSGLSFIKIPKVYDNFMKFRLEYQLSRLYDYLWFSEK